MRAFTRHLDLTELPLRGGEQVERCFSVDIEPIELGGLRYEATVREDGAQLIVTRVTGGFLINIRFNAVVYGPCFRCLSDVALEIEAEQEEFVPSTAERWAKEYSPFVEDLVVDVAGLAREALVLAFPTKVLCAESCRGLCSECGADLNVSSCLCRPEIGDPRWLKLREVGFDHEDSHHSHEAGE